MYVEQPIEFRETPNIKLWAILSQASYEEGATTIPEVGVHPSGWKRLASEQSDDDIVWPAWKHADAHNGAGSN